MQALKEVVVVLGVAVGILLGLTLAPAGAQAQGKEITSAWWAEMEALDAELRDGQWKKVAKLAPKLAQEMTEKSWFHTELPQLFAEVSLYEAIAEANLGRDTHAIWMWHIAQNLHRPILERDLSGYGEAAKLLYEYPLRAEEEIPFRFRETPQGPIMGTSFSEPRLVDPGELPLVMTSKAVGVDRRKTMRPLHVELIYDREGRPNEPVVVFPPDVHPAIVWAVLRNVPERKVEPARLSGDAIPFMLRFEVAFDFTRVAPREPKVRHSE